MDKNGGFPLALECSPLHFRRTSMHLSAFGEERADLLDEQLKVGLDRLSFFVRAEEVTEFFFDQSCVGFHKFVQ